MPKTDTGFTIIETPLLVGEQIRAIWALVQAGKVDEARQLIRDTNPKNDQEGNAGETLQNIIDVLQQGGKGSGNFGHSGRPGKVGGSRTFGSGQSYIGGNVTFSRDKDVKESRRIGKEIRAKKKQCYYNSIMALMAYGDDTEYVQGIVVFDDIPVPIDHGWLERDGKVIDPTIPDKSGMYYPRTRWTHKQALKDVTEQEIVPLRENLDNKTSWEFLRTVSESHSENQVKKHHYGPGDHPGTGTPQDVHSKGGGSGGGKSIMPMANPNGRDTMEQYRYPDGTWTPERQQLHDQIIDRFFADATPVDDPKSIIVGGGPAAGKTTLLNSGLINIPENHVLAAGDDIKALLPEYAGANANFVHEESAYLSKVIATKAAKEGYNVVMDGTGDSSLSSLQRKINMMRPNGQPIVGYYVTIDIETAVARSLSRAKKTGRYMPESVLRENHKGVSRVLSDAIQMGLFDHVELYDTSYSPPKQIMVSDLDQVNIIDNVDYDKFLRKGFE